MGTTRPIIEVPETRDYAVKIRHEGITAGWEQWYFVMSDAHWHAPECYLKLLHEHLSEAKDRNALVIDAGDFHEVISGAGDPRSSKGTLREEHLGVNYLDRIVERRVSPRSKTGDAHGTTKTNHSSRRHSHITGSDIRVGREYK